MKYNLKDVDKSTNIVHYNNSVQKNRGVNKVSENKNNMSLFLKTDFLLDSQRYWENDLSTRFNIVELNKSFRESVPVLEFVDWQIIKVEPGYVESVLPINPNSSNQHITHQAALMLLSADYTGGLALSTLFHQTPVVGFWALRDNYGAYMWGAKSDIKWHSPSFKDLICKARIDRKEWPNIVRRFKNHKVVVTTVRIEMFNENTKVAESNFTYWAQDTDGITKNAFDESRINILYEYKTKATARLIAGLRALEQDKSRSSRMFEDEYAHIIAGKHGITLAKRFCSIIPQIQNMVSARTKNLDDVSRRFIMKHKNFNIINIGSGYDTRFWRLNCKKGSVYDMDLPVVLTERRKIFNYSRKKNFHTVAIDLLEHDFYETISSRKDFCIDIPSLIIWEGGSMYFDKKVMSKILNSISILLSKHDESIFWFDYVSQSMIDNKTNINEIEKFMRNISRMGEPFINGFLDVKKELLDFSIECVENTESDYYLGSKDDIYKHYCFSISKGITKR